MTTLPPIQLENPTDRSRRRGTMRLSLYEGAFAMVMLALVEAFYIPYLNAMGASSLQIGFGASLPALAAGIIQIYTPIALYKSGSRKKLAVVTVAVQALCFVPFGLMCHLQTSWNVWPAVAAFVVSTIAGNLGAAAWADWMAHIVPRRKRATYFAGRNRLLGVMQLAVAVISGYLLDHAVGKITLMFTILWFVCFAARMTSAILTGRMYEPPRMARPPIPALTFFQFLASVRSSPFGRFSLAAAMMSFAVNFAGPFFTIHMLNNLKFSYLEYTIMYITPIAATIACLGLWGRIIEKIGPTLPLRLCALVIAMVPLPWVITENYIGLIVAQMISGVSWAGFNLCAFVFYLNASSSKYRISNISYFNAMNFLGVFCGATLGGCVGPYMPTIMDFSLQTVFLVSFVLRIAPVLLFNRIGEQIYDSKLTPVERVFFDPRLMMRTGITRSIFRLFKRI